MSDQSDWLEQTWEIKRQLARKYAEVSPSEQLRDMREAVEREWKERGWTPTQAPVRATTPLSS